MIDLIQLTDTCGDAVFVNPATVRMLSPMPGGKTVLTFGDHGQEADLTVEEPYTVIVRLMTGKTWLELQTALLDLKQAEAAEWAEFKAKADAEFALKRGETAGSA